MSSDHVWEIRTPGGMLGIEVARGLMAAAPVVLAHSLPERISVTVRDEGGAVVAEASDLDADGETPMARLCLEDGRVTRRQVWPAESDVGLPVLLPGGEVGILCEWWNAPDGSEWRWKVEFHNTRG